MYSFPSCGRVTRSSERREEKEEGEAMIVNAKEDHSGEEHISPTVIKLYQNMKEALSQCGTSMEEFIESADMRTILARVQSAGHQNKGKKVLEDDDACLEDYKVRPIDVVFGRGIVS